MRLSFLRSTKIAASAEPLTISSANHNAGLAVSPVRGIGETGCTVGWDCTVGWGCAVCVGCAVGCGVTVGCVVAVSAGFALTVNLAVAVPC